MRTLVRIRHPSNCSEPRIRSLKDFQETSRKMTRPILSSVPLVALMAAWMSIQYPPAQTSGEWRAYAADKRGSRYSPLDQINKETVAKLRMVWRQSVIPAELRERWPDAPVPNVSQNT